MDNLTETQTRAMIKEAGGSWKVFKEWMVGQTCPFVNSKPGYFKYDVDRFIRYKCNPANEPLSEWD